MAPYSVFAIAILLFVIGYCRANKRMILHSDEDVRQAISTLQTEFSTVTTKLQTEVDTLTAKLQAQNDSWTAKLQTEISALKSKLEMENNSLITKLQSEISDLKSKLDTENNTLTTKLQTEISDLKSKLETENNTLITKLQKEISALTNKLQMQNVTMTKHFQAEVSSLKSTLLSVTASNIGSTFIRWGRTVCPGNGSELVYHGLMAGSKFSETGGSSKSLCLPSDPLWRKYVDGYQSYAAIYGTEIDLDNQAIASALFGKNVLDQDIPCAVCRSSRSAHVMIPARSRCYAGWTEEYVGYIMSALPNHKSFLDYVCLDESLEFAPHGASNDNEHVIYPVEVRCGNQGSLPCPPFVDGRELACVVCTK